MRLREQAQVGSIPTRLRQRPVGSSQEAEDRKTFTSFRKSFAALLGFSIQEVADFVALTATFRSDISSPRTACFNLNTDISSAC